MQRFTWVFYCCFVFIKMSKFCCEACFTMNRMCDFPLRRVNINVLQMETFMCVSCKPVTVKCWDVIFPRKERKEDNEQIPVSPVCAAFFC